VANGSNEVTAEHLADLKSAREAQLVRKFVAGRPLLELEMSELAHLIPAAALANPPPLRSEYRREIPEYAAEIGVHKRSVYRWVDAGVEARDPVPLDQPDQILAWWGRHMSRSAPEYLVKWAANANPRGVGAPPGVAEEKAIASKNSSAGIGENEDPRASRREAIHLTGLSGMGLDASVILLRQTVEANAKLVGNAHANPDDTALDHYQNRLEKSIDQLRKAEAALFLVQKQRGDLAPKSEFRADLLTIATGLRGMMMRRANNVGAAVRLALDKLKVDPALSAELLCVVRAAVEAESLRDEYELRSVRTWQTLPGGAVVLPPMIAPAPAAAVLVPAAAAP
jgi:hypothetical protein